MLRISLMWFEPKSSFLRYFRCPKFSIELILFFSRDSSSRTQHYSRPVILRILLSIKFNFLRLVNGSRLLITLIPIWARFRTSIYSSQLGLCSNFSYLMGDLGGCSLSSSCSRSSDSERAGGSSKRPLRWSLTTLKIISEVSGLVSPLIYSLSFSVNGTPSNLWRLGILLKTSPLYLFLEASGLHLKPNSFKPGRLFTK